MRRNRGRMSQCHCERSEAIHLSACWTLDYGLLRCARNDDLCCRHPRKRVIQYSRDAQMESKSPGVLIARSSPIWSRTGAGRRRPVCGAIWWLSGGLGIGRMRTHIGRRRRLIEFRFQISSPFDQGRCQLRIMGQLREFEKHHRLAFHILPTDRHCSSPLCSGAGITRSAEIRSGA